VVPPWHVTSFYRFLPLTLEKQISLQQAIAAWYEELGVFGLFLVAPEGINATIAGSESALRIFRERLGLAVGLDDIDYKDSVSEKCPFHDARVDLREEIVGMKRPDVYPEVTRNSHLTPKEWHEFLESGEPYVMIDTRNRYETRIGKFKDAVDPDIAHFSQWPTYVDEADLPKDKPLLIYCTGGIRCEKVMVDLHQRGFEKVYQLRDGILGYLAEYPEGYFEGECFVFDKRVAVNAHLEPTKTYGVCPACGEPSTTRQNCDWCEGPSYVCEACEPRWGTACNKTCRDRILRHGPQNSNPLNASRV